MAFGNIVAFICGIISLVSDSVHSVAFNAIFTKSPVVNSAKKISLRFKKSLKNPKLTGT